MQGLPDKKGNNIQDQNPNLTLKLDESKDPIPSQLPTKSANEVERSITPLFNLELDLSKIKLLIPLL